MQETASETAFNELGVYAAMRTLRAVRRLRPDPIPTSVLQRVLEAAKDYDPIAFRAFLLKWSQR